MRSLFANEKKDKVFWADFTRRHDPAHPQLKRLLIEKLKSKGVPQILCFWSKAPAVLVQSYKDIILRLSEQGVLILAQITMNGYNELEPGVSHSSRQLDGLVKLLGPDHIRLRFDPIVPGYTRMEHFDGCLAQAKNFGIKHITLNFYQEKDKISKRMKLWGNIIPSSHEEQKQLIEDYLKRVPKEIRLALCAESAWLKSFYPELLPASCADPSWAISLKNVLGETVIWEKHPSRKSCGCFYSEDWGDYPGNIGVSCRHACHYCYAR